MRAACPFLRLSALDGDGEIPAVRARPTAGIQNSPTHLARHEHGEAPIDVRLLSDTIVGDLDVPAGVDATGNRARAC
jgi:hypothetical protein